ncbi:hypothetical protein D3C87_1239300 [compost metagenome]
MSGLAEVVERVADSMAEFPYPVQFEDDVNKVTQSFIGSGYSPVECVVVLSRTAMSWAVGTATAVSQGLHPAEITDREQLRQCVAALRASADIFEAIMREGAQ